MTAKAVGAAFNTALAAEGGSVPTWLILNALRHGQWTAQLDLARALGIESPTLTRHLDNLEQSGSSYAGSRKPIGGRCASS